MATNNGERPGSLSLAESNVSDQANPPKPVKVNYGTQNNYTGDTPVDAPFRVSSQPEVDASAFYAPFNDHTDVLANQKQQYIEIYHIPTKKRVFFKLRTELF